MQSDTQQQYIIEKKHCISHHFQQGHFEDQRRVPWNGWRGTTFAVRFFRRDRQSPFATHLHAVDANVPPAIRAVDT